MPRHDSSDAHRGEFGDALRGQLAAALIGRGFGGLVQAQDRQRLKPASTSLPRRIRRIASDFGIPTWASLTLAFTAVRLLDLPPWCYAVAGLLTIVLMGTLMPRPVVRLRAPTRSDDDPTGRLAFPSGRLSPTVVVDTPTIAPLLVPISVFVGSVEVASSDIQTFEITHGLPAVTVLILLALFAVFQLGRELIRRVGLRRLGANMTLLAPIAVVVLFAQLFSTEMWTVAANMTLLRGVVLACVTVLPLFALLFRKLTQSLPRAFETTANRLTIDDDRDRLSDRAEQLVSELRRASGAGDRAVRAYVRRALTRQRIVPRARGIADALSGCFSRPLFFGLLPVVIGTWVLMSTYIYLLAAIAIDRDDVQQWLSPSGSAQFKVPTLYIDLLGGVYLPVGPFVVISLLLGVLASAAFIASALTDEQYREVLADSALHGRVEECLVHAVPYVDLVTQHADPDHWEELDSTPAGSIHGDATYGWRDVTNDDLHVSHAVWYRWAAPARGWVTFVATAKGYVPELGLRVCEPSAMDSSKLPVALRGPGRASLLAATGAELEVCVGASQGVGAVSRPFTLTWEPSPDNAVFSSPDVLSDREGSVTGDTTYAWREENEPRHFAEGGRSVWYAWTAERSEWVIFETVDSEFDTLLAVYTGSALARLKLVAANDDAPGAGTHSRVHFRVRSGTRYSIAVDGYAGASGAFTLRWRAAPPPPNDAFARAQKLAGEQGEVTAETTVRDGQGSTADARRRWRSFAVVPMDRSKGRARRLGDGGKYLSGRPRRVYGLEPRDAGACRVTRPVRQLRSDDKSALPGERRHHISRCRGHGIWRAGFHQHSLAPGARASE